MGEVTTDFARALIQVVIAEADHTRVTDVLTAVQSAARGLAGRSIKCLADVRNAGVVSPEIAELLREHQQVMARLGVVQTAEIVTNSLVALQLNRVAREAGVDDRIRRFSTYEEARQWLFPGEAT